MLDGGIFISEKQKKLTKKERKEIKEQLFKEYPILSEGFKVSEEEPIRDGILTVFNHYKPYRECVKKKQVKELRRKAKDKNDKWEDLPNFILQQVPEKLVEIAKDHKFKIKFIPSGSTYYGGLPDIPWFAVLDHGKWDSSTEGYYPVYLFNGDITRVYLTLDLATTPYEDGDLEDLKHFKNIFKEYTEELFNANDGLLFDLENFSDPVDLGDGKKYKHAEEFSFGSIFAKCYECDNLPSEDVLENDFIEMLHLYEFTKNNRIFEKVYRFLSPKEFDIYQNFYDYLIKNNLHFSIEAIENYLLSLKVKPFVILTGNSGTGKTKLSQEFAKFFKQKTRFYCTRLNVNKSSYGDDKNFEINPRSNKFSNFPYSFIDYSGDCKININGKEFPIKVQFRPIISYEGNDDIVQYLKDKYVTSNYSVMIDSFDLSNCIIDGYQKKDKILEGDIKTLYFRCSDRQLNDCRIKIPVRGLDWKVSDFIPFEDGDCRIIIDNKIIMAKFEVFLYFHLPKKTRVEVKEFLENYEEPNVHVTIDTSSFKYSNEVITYDFSEIGININSSDYELIPVGANWTDNRNILGFYNVITKSYQRTNALDLILESSNDLNSPFFLILDEMNLSHVERYFSDFLSAIESKEDIPLYSRHNIENQLDVPSKLKIPENLFVIGTVNVDETTYMFSPKVLDRANVLEFETFSEESITLKRFMDCEESSGDTILDEYNHCNFSYLEDPLSDLGLTEKSMEFFKDEFSNINGEIWGVFYSDLEKVHSILKKSGFDFGFRVVKEIIAFMYVSAKYEGLFELDAEDEKIESWQKRYFDAQIKQKILPKIHGSKKVLDDTLDELLAFCIGCEMKELDKKLESDQFPLENSKYPTSAKKIAEMREVLENQRYVSFIN